MSDCRVRLLCLSQDLRQRRHQLPNHLTHVLLRKLALLLAAPLRLLLLAAPLRLLLLAAPLRLLLLAAPLRLLLLTAPLRLLQTAPLRLLLTAILAVLLAVSCLSVTTLSIATKSITADRLHRWRAGPRAVGLGLIESCPLLRMELGIVRGILLLGFVVNHRLFSLRWVAPLSPQSVKTIGLRARSIGKRAKLRHSGMTKSLTHDHSTEINQAGRSLSEEACPYPVNVSAVSRTRDICHVRDEWQRNCVGGKDECGLLLLAAFRLVASGPWFRFDALVLDVRSRIIREHKSGARIHRRRDFFAELQRYFCGNTVHGSGAPRSFAA